VTLIILLKSYLCAMSRLIILLAILFLSCAKATIGEIEVYSNDFEDGNLSGIANGNISSFAGTNVLGMYNAGGFDLTINDLPSHSLVDITFDLYIHDSWDGNQQALDGLIGPDIWQLKIDDKSYINTTFSNGDCLPGNFCPPQSYPADYPNNNNNPKSGASEINLPGVCSQVAMSNGSTLYKIHKRIDHKANRILIQGLDKLVQRNVTNPKCDESWSVDNIHVKVIKLK
jgi:hypothetical protein